MWVMQKRHDPNRRAFFLLEKNPSALGKDTAAKEMEASKMRAQQPKKSKPNCEVRKLLFNDY